MGYICNYNTKTRIIIIFTVVKEFPPRISRARPGRAPSVYAPHKGSGSARARRRRAEPARSSANCCGGTRFSEQPTGPRVDLSVTNLDITREDLSIRTVSIERVGHPRRFVVSTNPHDAPPIAIRN